jgi:hypothetical protein
MACGVLRVACPGRWIGVGPNPDRCGRRALLVAAPAVCAYSRGAGLCSMTPSVVSAPGKLCNGLPASVRLYGCCRRAAHQRGWSGNRGPVTAASDTDRQNKTPQVAGHLRRRACTGGEGGIRTRGGVTLTRFPIVRIRPDYATSPRTLRRGHYTIVAGRRQIRAALEAAVDGRWELVLGSQSANIKIPSISGKN